ncbi:MAG: HD domain-containing protein [Nitrospirae bacterium]|nr:MAG: HD domain-containing protein [Nitrospirota bacterium]
MLRWWWRLLDWCLPGRKDLEISLEELSTVWQAANRGMRSLEEVLAEPPDGLVVPEVVAATREEPQTGGEEAPEVIEAESAPVVPDEAVSANPAPAASGSQAEWLAAGERSPMTETFLVPYERLLRNQGVWEPLIMMVGMLEVLGHCPSVVTVAAEADKEARRELYPLKDTLGKVTLRNHTELVTHLALQEVRSHYRNPELVIAKMLVAALGHDLGKIPEYRTSGVYTKKDHPEISVVKVRELFEGRVVPWLDDALELIRTHHDWTKHELGLLLRQADGKAREIEVAKIAKDLRIEPWERWCTPEALCAVLAERVNVVDRAGKWQAIAYKGTVFCTPELLWWAARELARRSNVIDIRLVRESDKEVVLRRIATQFREAGLLSYPVGEGYYGRKFRIHGPESRRKRGASQWYCLPIAESAFGEKVKLFQELKGVTEAIHDVELVA